MKVKLIKIAELPTKLEIVFINRKNQKIMNNIIELILNVFIDIIVGVVVGIILAMIIIWIHDKLFKKSQR